MRGDILPDLNGKNYSFSPLNMMSAIGFLKIFFFIKLRKFPSSPALLKVPFLHKM